MNQELHIWHSHSNSGYYRHFHSEDNNANSKSVNLSLFLSPSLPPISTSPSVSPSICISLSLSSTHLWNQTNLMLKFLNLQFQLWISSLPPSNQHFIPAICGFGGFIWCCDLSMKLEQRHGEGKEGTGQAKRVYSGVNMWTCCWDWQWVCAVLKG